MVRVAPFLIHSVFTLHCCIFTSPPEGVQSIVMSLSVCVSAHILQKLHPNFTKFPEHVTYNRGSVVFWQQCNTLCTFSFVNDVMFAHNQRGKGNTNRVYTQSDSPGGRTV